MANKTANIDFGQSINRMNRMTNEKQRTEQPQEGRGEPRNVDRPTEPERPSVVQTEAEVSQVPPTAIATEERRGPGRKKRENNIRTNPKTVFFDDATSYALAMVKLNNGIDKKDLILSATRLFLEKYYQSDLGRLSEDGVAAIFHQLGGNK